MIKVGDTVKIVSLHERDGYFKDGISGSIGIVEQIDNVTNKKGINYYAGYIHIIEPSSSNIYADYADCLEDDFYFAYAQLRKVRK